MDGQSRYVIGIDLGTTNCAVAYVDTDETQNPGYLIRSFALPQLTHEGVVKAQEVLPSFAYLPAEYEFTEGACDLPWRKVDARPICGVLARERGSRVPTRLVQSAKSWLCHAGADRNARFLPLEAADPEQRMSPVGASAEYLRHISEAWNARMAKSDPNAVFEEQEIVLTVPASFDEMARSLTVEAARQAGYQQVTLLEEPQAAFYAWIAKHHAQATHGFLEGERILVCDVGGGTTDLSLIEVSAVGEQLKFQRMAVGDHLLLGGDNMDRAIGHYLEGKLKACAGSHELALTQQLELLHQARTAKERLLSTHGHTSYQVTLQGKGSSMVAGSLSTDIDSEELHTILMEGFLANHSFSDATQARPASALRSTGLPYEEEPSITKHIARFLKRSAANNPVQRPDYVLFNGGTMYPELFRQRILTCIGSWFDRKPPKELSADSLDLAVSRGAAYFGKVRRGLGIRIGGGTPRAFYLGVEVDGKRKALTLLPRGTEEGVELEVARSFKLMANRPVLFPLYSSHVRLSDQANDVVDIDSEQMRELPPIQTVLRYGKATSGQQEVDVRLHIKLTEIGTLELWLEAPETGHRWSLEFQLRSASGQENNVLENQQRDADETLDRETLTAASQLIRGVYEGDGAIKPKDLVTSLEAQLQKPRLEWPPSVLRALADSLLDCEERRLSSAAHRERWWQLLGFLLRPGFGYPLDDHRIKRLWRAYLAERQSDVHVQICLRRVACGLSKGQQLQVAQALVNELLPKKAKLLEKKKGQSQYVYDEQVRLLGSLERLPLDLKLRLGNALIKGMQSGQASSAELWALTRIGARHLVAGAVADVIPREQCAKWVDQLLELYTQDPKGISSVISHLARKTDQRELDLPESLRSSVLEVCQADANMQRMLTQTHGLDHQEQTRILGDQLPVGLSLA